MQNRTLETIIPISEELPVGLTEEYSIDIEDSYTMETGEHMGRIGGFTIFQSKDKQTTYAKISLGTRKNFAGKHIIQEVDRVFLAEYHTESELVKLMIKLGAIDKHKFFPDRLLNKAVKFTVKLNENAKEDSKYKEMVTDIELIDNLSEDNDFKYVRIYTANGVQYVPVTLDAKKEDLSPIKCSNTKKTKIELPDEDDFLVFDE